MRTALITTALLAGLAGTATAENLIVTGQSGILQTIDLDTGTVGQLGVCTGSVRSMAVADGTLYLGVDFGTVHRFDLDTNQVVDSFAVPVDNSAMAWDGQRLVIGDADRTVVYVNPDTGAVEQTIENVGTDVTAIGIDSGGMYVGGQSSIAMRAHIGQTDFSFFAACGSFINAMAFSADTMYLGGSAFGGSVGTIYKFDKFVGGVNYVGTFPTPNNASAVLAHNGLLYVGGSDAMIHEIEPDTGAILRSFDMGLPVTGIAPTTGLVSCPADYDVSGDLNFFDIAQFVGLFAQALPAADTNGDGTHDFFDVERFIDTFNAGCP